MDQDTLNALFERLEQIVDLLSKIAEGQETIAKELRGVGETIQFKD